MTTRPHSTLGSTWIARALKIFFELRCESGLWNEEKSRSSLCMGCVGFMFFSVVEIFLMLLFLALSFSLGLWMNCVEKLDDEYTTSSTLSRFCAARSVFFLLFILNFFHSSPPYCYCSGIHFMLVFVSSHKFHFKLLRVDSDSGGMRTRRDVTFACLIRTVKLEERKKEVDMCRRWSHASWMYAF